VSDAYPFYEWGLPPLVWSAIGALIFMGAIVGMFYRFEQRHGGGEWPYKSYCGADHSGGRHPPSFQLEEPTAMKLAKPEPCCFIGVSSPRRCAQTALPGPSLLGRSAKARGAPLQPLMAVAIIVASVVSVFAIVPAVIAHVSAILPDIGLSLFSSRRFSRISPPPVRKRALMRSAPSNPS